MTKKGNVVTTITLSQKMDKWLKDEAEAADMSKAAVVRLALEYYRKNRAVTGQSRHIPPVKENFLTQKKREKQRLPQLPTTYYYYVCPYCEAEGESTIKATPEEPLNCPNCGKLIEEPVSSRQEGGDKKQEDGKGEEEQDLEGGGENGDDHAGQETD